MSLVPNALSWNHLLIHRAEQTPDEIAYVFLSEKDLPTSLTYRELYARVRFIASHLQERLQSKNSPVLLLLEPGFEYIAAFLGCLYAGAIPVPAYPPTSARKLPRLQAIINDSQAHCAITTSADMHRISVLQNRQEKLSITEWVVLDSLQEPLAQWVDPGASADTIAFLQYTSGSTSSPKGVMVSHGNLLKNIEYCGRAIGVCDSDVTVSWLPPYHDFGLIGGILGPLFWGHRCIFMRPASFLINPYRWLKAISDHRGSISSAPNFAYDLCVRSITPEQLETLDLSSWRIAFNGAEPVRVDTMRNFTQVFGPCGFNTESMTPSYGLAEATLGLTIGKSMSVDQISLLVSFSKSALQHLQIQPSLGDLDAISLISVGHVLPEHEVAIIDPKSLKRTLANGIGEVWVRGPSVAHGYWNRPETTKEVFQAYIADSGEGPYLRTGDLGFFHDNQMFICGRLKDVIIINGKNIYPQDVESTSFNSHPKLRADGAIAFGLKKEQGESLVVVQELGFRAQPDDAMFGAIASAVAEEIGLPPDTIVMVKAGQLPRTSSGKIQRQLCKKQFLDGELQALSRWDRPTTEHSAVTSPRPGSEPAVEDLQQAPQTTLAVAEMERLLIDRLATRVGIPAESVDTKQPFAYYGLDSLASLQLAEELSARLNHTVTPTVFWDYPSIAQLAVFLVLEPAVLVPAASRSSNTPEASEPIAIVGMGCQFPQADDVESFWNLLKQGSGVTGPVPPQRLAAQTFVQSEGSAHHVSMGGFLAQVDLFDPQFFGISPLEAERIDPQQRLVLEVAWQALESAGVPPSSLAETRAGVFVGISTHDYESRQTLSDEALTVYAATGSAHSIAANRLSYVLDLRGPSVAVDTACSSSLVAVHLACQSLRSGESTLALAGGVNLILSSESSMPFANAGMLAANGLCKAFDAAADGYVRGEGCGMVVLKRLSDALRDGDPIRAVIRGSAIGQDGRSNGLIAPNGAAQADLLRRALDDAQLSPVSIAYLEAHGTGTVLGDPIELRALKEVLMPGRLAEQACAIGTVKTNIGHLEAAAGIAGLIKTALVVENGMIVPNLNFITPNPHCSLDNTPLFVATSLLPWKGQPTRFAGVSSFGFGGALAHVVLQQAPASHSSGDGWSSQLLTFSAKTESALELMSDELAARIEESPSISLADVAFSHQVGRNAFGVRRMLVCSSNEDAACALRNRTSHRVRSASLPPRLPQLVFMFPGQGTQAVGMARELYQQLPNFRIEVDACAVIVLQQTGFDIRELIGLVGSSGEASDEQLTKTKYAQPALFVIEYAMARLWMSYGVQPHAMIGHSLGEFVAACLAGVFSLVDALSLVTARGCLMQGLAEGAMLSVGLDEEQILPHLNSGVSLAAVNGRQRCVVSGSFADVQALELGLDAQGVSHRRLHTSHAFHSHLMDPALVAFGALLTGISLNAPKLPFVSNLTGEWITDAEATSSSYWVRHLREPVRFAQGLTTLSVMTAATGAVLVEVGPGRTLATLARQHAKATDCEWTTLSSLATTPSQTSDLTQHLATLGQLWLGGVVIDWNAVYSGQQRRRLQLPTYPFERQRHWIEGVSAIASATAPVNLSEEKPSQRAWEVTSALPVRRIADIERETCAIIAELLHIDPNKVDPHSSLLELGADSLILVQAVSSIKKQFGITLSIRQLFEELTTISTLAVFIAQQIEPAATAQMTADPVAAVTTFEIDALAYGTVDHRHDDLTPERLAAVGDNASLLERTIARQLESLSQITKQTTQVLLQQLEAVKASNWADVTAQAALMTKPVAPQCVLAAAVTASLRTNAETPSRFTQFDPYAKLTPHQSAYLKQFILCFLERTRGSKDSTVANKAVHADYRAQAGFRFSASDPVLPLTLHELFYPIISERAAGSHIWDVDGNDYVDLTMGFGVHFFGHGPEFIQQALMNQMQLGTQIGPQSPLAGEVAQLVHELTGMERVAFCNSGTEAVMLAIRLARTTTGREKFVMFNGSYHGWSDGSLVGVDIDQNERGTATPLMPGLTPGIGQHALVLEYAEAESLDIIRRHAHELAAVIVEPVQGRHPELQPREFLHKLRALTKELGIPLIFDEVITGFRMHQGGAQAMFGVQADIAIYGKAAGGGMPLGMVAGNARYMDGVDGGPRSRVDGRTSTATTFFAGTFSKHPLTMAATRAVLQKMKHEGPSLQEGLTRRTIGLVERINQMFEREQVSMRLVQCGSLFRLNTTSNLDLFCYHLVARGLYIWEGRNMFLSTAHSDADLERIFHAFEASVLDLRDGGFLPPLPPNLPSQASSWSANETFVAEASTTTVASADTTLALTATQQGIWLECQLDDEATLAYNTKITLKLRGTVDHAKLDAALQHVVDRHDALRTVIAPSGEWQRVLPAMSISLKGISFAQFGDAAAQVQHWQAEESQQPFELSRGPLLRATLVQERADQYLLCLTVHHVVSDGISVAILVQELAHAYSALRKGKSPILPAAQRLRSYVSQHHSYLDSEQYRQDEAYWISRFAPMPPPLVLPSCQSAHRQSSLRTGHRQFIIDSGQYQALQQIGREHGCTLFMTLMAVMSVLLQRLTHQEDMVIGIPVAVDRPDDDDAHLIGCTVNMVPVRFSPRATMPFSRYLADVKASLVDAYMHSSYPFTMLTRKLGTSHTSSTQSLISVMFNLDRPAVTPVFDGLEVSLSDSPMHFGLMDLLIDVLQLPDKLIVKIQYKQDLFDDSMIERMAGHLEQLLAGIVENVNRAISDIPLLTEAERELLLVKWNDTARAYPKDKCVHELFEEQVARTPDAVALVYEEDQLTYADLNQRSNQLAHRLRELGVRPEVLVGICVERSLRMVVGLLGILKAGGAYVPLDPSYPKDRLAYMLADANPHVLLTQERILPELPNYQGRVLCLDRDWSAQMGKQPKRNPKNLSQPQNLAYVIYTSGSTGMPKGVAMPNQALVNLLSWQMVSEGNKKIRSTAQYSPVSFDVSFQEIFLTLLEGSCLTLITEELHRDLNKLVSFLEKSSIDRLFVPFVALNQISKITLDRNCSLPMREIITAGEQLIISESIQNIFESRDGYWLRNQYGPTETHVVTAYSLSTNNISKWVLLPPIGRPIANTQIYILDSQLRPVPIGVAGELHIGGAGLARGYLNKPELTAEKFIKNPFSEETGSRLYKTGDLARYLEDGNIEYLGRIDHQVKLRGFRIELGEIESVLQQDAQISQAVVLLREDKLGDKRLVAYVVGKEKQAQTQTDQEASLGLVLEQGFDVDALRQYLKTKLPEYMVPSGFVVLADIPLTPNGKVDRRALPVPSGERQTNKEYVEPRTETEKTLAVIWADVLKVDKVGIHDNFFELGGHSMLATRLVSLVSKDLGQEVPLMEIFKHSTLFEFSQALDIGKSSYQEIGKLDVVPFDDIKLFVDRNVYEFEKGEI